MRMFVVIAMLMVIGVFVIMSAFGNLYRFDGDAVAINH